MKANVWQFVPEDRMWISELEKAFREILANKSLEAHQLPAIGAVCSAIARWPIVTPNVAFEISGRSEEVGGAAIVGLSIDSDEVIIDLGEVIDTGMGHDSDIRTIIEVSEEGRSAAGDQVEIEDKIGVFCNILTENESIYHMEVHSIDEILFEPASAEEIEAAWGRLSDQ